MAALKNPRHEHFAQELAKGATQVEAYGLAGYNPHDGAAARLCGNVRIQARVAELKERAAVRAEISIASATEALLRIAKKGEDLAEAPGLAVARGAIMDAAKLNGLVVDKSQVDATARVATEMVDRPPRETRAEWEARRARQLEGPG
jgi:hypothetical protein